MNFHITIIKATRIDRQYHWGDISIIKSEYFPVAFSDHFGLFTEVEVPFNLCQQVSRRGSFKIKNDVACDPAFKDLVATEMVTWKEMLIHGLDVLTWWEIVVKLGVRRNALKRARELKAEWRSEVNMLYIKQAYLVKRLKSNVTVDNLTALKYTQSLICKLYEKRSKKIQVQARSDEFVPSEATRIYHHELHKKYIKRSSIVLLDTEDGQLEGHNACAKYLHKKCRSYCAILLSLIKMLRIVFSIW